MRYIILFKNFPWRIFRAGCGRRFHRATLTWRRQAPGNWLLCAPWRFLRESHEISPLPPPSSPPPLLHAVRASSPTKSPHQNVAVTTTCVEYLTKSRGITFMQYKSPPARLRSIFARFFFFPRPPRAVGSPLGRVSSSRGKGSDRWTSWLDISSPLRTISPRIYAYVIYPGCNFCTYEMDSLFTFKRAAS